MPRRVPPLAEIPGLPPIVRSLALVYLHAPGATSDHILLLSDALREAAEGAAEAVATPALILANLLANRARDYA